MHFKSASDLRELEILERRKIRVVEEDYGYDDDEVEEEDLDGRFYSGSSSGLGYSERSTRSQACSTDDLLGKADYRRLMASGLVSSSASTSASSRLSRSQSILATTPSPTTTSAFARKRRQLPKCPQEIGAPPPTVQPQSLLARQQSMLEGTTRERLEKMTRNRMLRDQILQDQMSQAAATPVVPEMPLGDEEGGESPLPGPLQGRRLHAVSRRLSRRRSFLEKARDTIRTATTVAAAVSASGVEPLPGLRSGRPSLARKTSFLESKPVRKMAKLARR